VKTTTKHFAEFKRYHAEYLTKYGLLQWCIQYEHRAGETTWHAETEPHFAGKVATVRLAVEWGELRPLNTEQLRKTAKHEVNHLLLYSLYWHATARYISPDTLQEAEEAIVRTLDRLIPN
jgi:hypothetical protein